MSSSSFATPTERLAAFFDSPPRPVWEDRDIDEIALLLEQCEHVASVCPRTYILFRTIGCVDTLEQLVKVGFGDQFFPVDSRSLPSFLEPSVRSAVVQHQGIILTKSLDLENGRHRHFTPSEALPFEILGRLGSGGYGQVDRIRSKTSFKLYALKRIRRRAAFGNASSREAVKGFLNEMKIMRGLEHRHVVRYIGSYTDKSHLGLVMSPVADSDLAAYNERLCGYYQVVQAPGFTSTVREGIWSLLSSVSSLQLQDQPVALEMSSNLRTYFGCLTAALAYLHDQNIRHKDIKPQNILICKGNILFADFGLSRDFADDVGSTTSGLTPASPRYSAPEVATYEARNTSSDIWSLGCVFIEMTAALHGLNVDRIKDFYARSGSRSVHFHSNPSATGEFIKELKNTARPTDKPTLLWIGQMLFLERNARPTAAHVLEMITSSEDNDTDSTANMFCGICCVPDFESDSMDSLADDFDVVTTVRQPDPDAQPHSVAKDTFQAVSDALPVGPPSLETTTGTEIEAPTSFPEAAHNAPGISSRTSPSEETLVTETTHAKAVDPDHGLDESNLQESPGQVQSPALRSIDDMEYHVAEPKANEQARMVISPHNFKLTATGNLDDSLSAAPKLRERVEYQTSWYANQNNRPLEPGNSPATFTQEAPNSGLLLDANTASGAMIPAVPEIGSSSNPYTASTYHSQIGRAIGDGGESILGLKTAYENARQERKAIPQRVFGVPLHLSIEYAYINLTQYPTFVGGYINGPIPIVIARCCEMTRSSRKT
jgi:serine/threonine protein kinase